MQSLAEIVAELVKIAVQEELENDSRKEPLRIFQWNIPSCQTGTGKALGIHLELVDKE
jgi:hypothetical protein